MATATIRELRNNFPRVRKLVDEQGEVVVTEKGTPRFRLTLYVPPRRTQPPPSKDYIARLRKHQPRTMTAAEAKALDEANRGSR